MLFGSLIHDIWLMICSWSMFGINGKFCLFLYLKVDTCFYHCPGLNRSTNIDIPHVSYRNYLQRCEPSSIKCGFFSRTTTQVHELQGERVAYINSSGTSMPRAEMVPRSRPWLFIALIGMKAPWISHLYSDMPQCFPGSPSRNGRAEYINCV